MDLQGEVLKFCNSLGIQKIGFIKVREFNELEEFYKNRKDRALENPFEEEDIEKRINPKHYMEKGKTIVSIAFPYCHEGDYFDNGFSIYTRGLDYHKVLHKYLDKICDFLRNKGYEASSFVDSNTLPERYIAYLAGIGFIGKNNMIITEEYGSYVFLGEIITDAKIYNEDKGTLEEISQYINCKECEICLKECPTKAINKGKSNSNICLSYITQKKVLEYWEEKALKGRVFGCDSCQLMCPYNKEIKYSNIEDFKPLAFMNNDNLDRLINISNKEFKESFKVTSCGWRGKNVLKRNGELRRKHND